MRPGGAEPGQPGHPVTAGECRGQCHGQRAGPPLCRLWHDPVAPDAPVPPLLRRDEQPLWTDPETGFQRRAVSPPARSLAGEALECRLEPGTRLAYDAPPRQGLEHHLLMLEGRLAITVDGATRDLEAGDCLRYRLAGPSAFATPARSGARYLLFLV